MPNARFVLLRRFAALAILVTSSSLLAVPCAAAAPAPAAAPAVVESGSFTRAQTLFHERKFKEAIALLYPYYFRGLAYNRIESYRLALEDMQIYVQRRPQDPDGYRERVTAMVAAIGAGKPPVP